MKPSGLNSIEYGAHMIGGFFKWFITLIGLCFILPVVWLLWSWSLMNYQARAIDSLNAAPVLQQVVIDFNQCQVTDEMVVAEIPRTETVTFSNYGAMSETLDLPSIPKSRALPFGTATPVPFFYSTLPWAPGLVRDQKWGGPTGWEDITSADMTHYRIVGNPRWDPWYGHGLFKMAPTKKWDWGTGPDYAFGKCAGNYRAYVGAVRAVAAMRAIKAAQALGIAPSFSVHAVLYREAQNPVGAYYALMGHCEAPPSSSLTVKAFTEAYRTSWGDRLPVVTLDLQKFDPEVWGNPGEGEARDWDNYMGWHPLCGIEDDRSVWGHRPARTFDLFITGLRLKGQGPHEGRPRSSRLDFLLWNTPSTTRSQDKALDALTALTTDAFWDPLIDAGLRGLAHQVLKQIRKDLEHDYKFARRFGHVAFNGDALDRNPSVMK